MKSLRRLGAVIALLFALALTAFADCLPPDPGETHSPPCSAAQIPSDDPSGETTLPAASETRLGLSFTEVAIDLAESVLLLF
jgi:hypothetical protein